MSKSFRLRTITANDELRYMDYIQKWGEESSIIPYTARLRGRTFEAFLSDLELSRKGLLDPWNLVPDETFIMVDDTETIYGVLNLRFYLSDILFRFYGHIGYGILPDFQNKGYGTFMLQLGLTEASKRGLDSVLITTSIENIGSQKVIEKCGGVFENTVENEEELINRYWVKTSGSLLSK